MTEMLSNEKKENPWWIRASFGSREMFSQWGTSAFGFFTIIFYETVVGLEYSLAITVFLLYSAWNAVNDPFLGFLLEKFPMPWQKKKGYKRFPWIMIAAIPWLFSYLMIFMVPVEWDPLTQDKWKIFAWYIGSLILFDTLFSLFDINSGSLFPEKFKGLNERRGAQGWGTVLGISGIVLAFFFAQPAIEEGVVYTRVQEMGLYRDSATTTLIGGIILFLFLIPGVYENKKMRLQNLANLEQGRSEKGQFFNSVKEVVKNKAFVVKMLFYFGYQASVALVNASGLYVTIYILDDPGWMILLLGPMLGGALITVPFWVYIGKRVNNNKKMGIIAGTVMFISFIPMIFITNPWVWSAFMFLFGAGLGAQWWVNVPLMGDIIDDHAVRTGKYTPSVFLGYQTFFIRFGEAFKAITIFVAHEATGWIPGISSLAEMQATIPDWELAVFGIRIHTAIVPAILVAVTTILFWLFYPLTPAKIAENKGMLVEMGLEKEEE